MPEDKIVQIPQSSNLERKFHAIDDYYAEEIVAVNADGTPIGGGGGGTVGLTDAELRATPVPVSGTAVYRTQSMVTSTVLGVAGIYTSAGVDGLNFRRLTGRVIASHAGVLHVEHSDDNATWDSIDPLTVAADTGYGFDFPVFARYIRLRYVNGATLQTSFRLSGYLAAA